MSQPIIELLLINIRSAHNVGAIARSADGFAVSQIICAGHTPYPLLADDDRLPHVASAAQHKIAKTALGAETSLPFSHVESPQAYIRAKRAKGYQIIALEQSPQSVDLGAFKPQYPCLLLLGEETQGLDTTILKLADVIVEIPMGGQKESLNVSSAAAIALYQLRRA